MKINIVTALVSIALVKAVPFGPQGCIDISKSEDSTCVFRTNCGGVDTSKVEFAFDCLSSAGTLQKHSFGFGGFDDNEEYDTAVKCKECGIPQQAIKTSAKANQHVMAVRTKSSSNEEKEETKKEEKKEEKKEVKLTPPAGARIARYGPGDCVSTWRDPTTTHCVVQTNCQGQNTKEYLFGLICDGSAGPQRHIFGKDSFDEVETFDTLIPCTECLALDAIPEDVELAKEITELGDSIKGMQTDMTSLETDVTKLQDKVLEKEEKKEEEAKKENNTVFFLKEHDKQAAGTSDDSEEEQYNALSDNDIDEVAKDSKLRGHGGHKKKHKVHHMRRHHHRVQEVEEDADNDDEDADSDDEQEHQSVAHTSVKHTKRKKVFRKDKSEETKSDADTDESNSDSTNDDESDNKEVAADADTDESASNDKDDGDSDRKEDDDSDNSDSDSGGFPSGENDN